MVLGSPTRLEFSQVVVVHSLRGQLNSGITDVLNMIPYYSNMT